jgi:hypothetical protein
MAGVATALPPDAAGLVTVVSCRVEGTPVARAYELQRRATAGGDAWQLVMRGGDAGTRPVVLPLPHAAPELAASGVTLTYRSGNGGRLVTLRATPASTLDVWVDYGLEVNVDTALDPRVDLMNTDGAKPATCTRPGR